MKKRLTIAGVLVVAVGIVAGKMGMFPGLGNGSGSNADTQVSVGAENPTPPPKKSDPPIATPENDTDSKTSTDPPNVLEVIIDDRSYQLRQSSDGKEEYVAIELPALISLAKKTPGDEDGIRVRISRRESSRLSAESQLQEELTKAGLSRSAIQWREGLLP